MSSELRVPVLDASQRRVVHAAPEDRLVVIAAAGQGKTEVVLARLADLSENDVHVQDEALVLSFSRAAVDTVRRRARGTGLDNVDVRTFDSFAAQILFNAGELEEVSGFGQRIRRATELIRDGDVDLDEIQHVIVDESQDLVGDRAELVLALLKAVPDAGFTILGDPLQGIYDFQLDEESESQRTSSEFLGELERELGAEHASLEGHYRAESPRMRHLIPVADRIRTLDDTTEATAGEAFSTLDHYRRSMPEGPYTSPLDKLSGYLDPDADETTAVLGATNFEVLLTSDLLQEMGVRHVIRRRARDMGIASWVAKSLVDLPSRTCGRDDVEAAFTALDDVPEDAWQRLKEASAEFRDHTTIDLRRLRTRLAAGVVPLGLTPPDASPITLSTVHRAKGLEFDHVIDLVPHDGPAAETTWRNVRRTYVSTSRARESLFLVPSPAPKGYFPKQHEGRWTELAWGKRRQKYVFRVEIHNEDVETGAPPDDEVEHLVTGQQALASGACVGEPVELVLATAPVTRQQVAHYRVQLSDGTVVGRTSNNFGWAVRDLLLHRGRRDEKWPPIFSGARIASVEGVAGDPFDTHQAGLGQGGYWLVPRLAGLVRPRWS